MRWRDAGAAAIATALVVAGAASVSSCKSTPSATLSITVGDELDAFSRAPAPTTLIVENVGLDGNVAELSRTSLPADEISLGDKGRTDVGALRISAVDAAGKKLLKGESLFVQFGALETTTFEVFVQRTGELARLPRAPISLDAPQVQVALSRYVLAVSGINNFLYDLLSLKSTAPFPALPRPAKSLATFGSAAIVIDENGATVLDLSSGIAKELSAPTGEKFADIAGGLSVQGSDASVYVMGGTRPTGGASPKVLVISPAGDIAFGALAAPREGACATWVEGRGVFVYGGAAAPEAAAEILVPHTLVGTKLPYPPDPVKGCGATTLDGSHVLVVGGVGSPTDVNGAALARVIDLACAANCTPAPWPGPQPLVRADAFTLAADAALVAGDDATGASHLFRFSAGAPPKEIALKVPRRGARLIALPVKGTAAIVGGAGPIEQYVE